MTITPREREVIELAGQHLMNKEIAKRLGISISTVKGHVHNALQKLGVDSRYKAAEVMRGQA